MPDLDSLSADAREAHHFSETARTRLIAAQASLAERSNRWTSAQARRRGTLARAGASGVALPTAAGGASPPARGSLASREADAVSPANADTPLRGWDHVAPLSQHGSERCPLSL
jgi:hypothetical protein